MPLPRPLRAACALALIAGPAAAFDAVDYQEGIARERDDDARIVYREAHWRYTRDGLAHRLVLYRCPGGPAFRLNFFSTRGVRPVDPDNLVGGMCKRQRQ